MRNKLVMIGIGLVAFLVISPLPGAFAVITLDSSGTTVYQQTTNNPCVIGDPSCKQGGLIYTSSSGPSNPYDFTSPVYDAIPGNTVVPPNQIPSSFTLGIDVNYAGGQGFESLVFFNTFVSDTGVAGTFSLDPNNSFGSGSNLTQHNGNGFSDALLLGFVLDPTKFYYFEVSWANDTDGMEEFFIIPAGTPPVPEPSALLLLGSGLVGLSLYGRKAFKR